MNHICWLCVANNAKHEHKMGPISFWFCDTKCLRNYFELRATSDKLYDWLRTPPGIRPPITKEQIEGSTE